jgi:2-keto-4-pentenoate hydratase
MQSRIEPEICFKLKAAPRSSQPDELLACAEWVAHSVEIVQCRQPGWKGVTVGARLPNTEFITTGTLTDAHPVARGETWTTQIRGLPLHGLKASFE